MGRFGAVSFFRYLLSAAVILFGIGLFFYELPVTGVLCILAGILCMPIVYACLRSLSKEVQVIAPLVLLLVAAYSYGVLRDMPSQIVLKTEYVPAAYTHTTSTEYDEIVYISQYLYHKNDYCPYSYRIKDRIKLSEAEERGLVPCPRCT